jgi:hypothetical protein
MVVLCIDGLNTGESTPFDGQYVQEYDPSKQGFDPTGRPMLCHLATTSDPNKALQFKDCVEALEAWKLVDSRNPVRADGQPNRPLTAFSVLVIDLEKAKEGLVL